MRLLVIASLVGLSACSVTWNDDQKGDGVAGSGSGTARTFAVADFTSIDLTGTDNVDVRVGAGFSVRAEGPSDQLDRLRLTRDGDTLDIGRKKGVNWGDKKAVTVYVTMPRLAQAVIAGAGNMTIDRVEGAQFDAKIAGSGDMNVGTLAVDRADLSIAGSGNIGATGVARQLGINIAGSGDIDAPTLQASRAEVKIAGAGNVRAAVTGPASVKIMGVGDVDLGPAADCTVKKMGTGSVRCR